MTFRQPQVMGIINATPDSFFAGSRYTSDATLLTHVEQMLKDGASLLDIGGASTRPGAPPVSESEELQRVIPVVEAIHRQFPECLISIDTYRSAVAEAAAQHGASIINDISGGDEDPLILQVAARYSCPFILMHKQGTVDTMHQPFAYTHFMAQVLDDLQRKTSNALAAGVQDIVWDPGFGFSKSLTENYHLLRHLNSLTNFGFPVLAGLSRKSMWYKLLDKTPDAAINATTAGNTLALQQGAAILRVHDVREAMEVVRILQQLNAS